MASNVTLLLTQPPDLDDPDNWFHVFFLLFTSFVSCLMESISWNVPEYYGFFFFGEGSALKRALNVVPVSVLPSSSSSLNDVPSAGVQLSHAV